MTKIMKTVVVSLLLLATCFAVENKTTELKQQLKVQKREKQYLIEDDPNEGPEQKRDERQSTLFKNNNHLDPKGNSRIINIRLQPNMLTAPIKQLLKAGVLQKPYNDRIDITPQIIPTKPPVILKTAKFVQGPAQALRMKMLQNKINDSSSNTDINSCPNHGATSPITKNNSPHFTIEDKITRKAEGPLGPITVKDENLLESSVTLNKDGKEADNNGKSALNESNKDQVPTNSKETPEAVQKPVPFFVDEPEPLPPSIRKQYLSETKEITPNKPKEIPLVKTGNKKPKKKEFRKKFYEIDETNDPDIVQISNGTHIISIKKIQNNDRYYDNDTVVVRNGEQDTTLIEDRIINQAPPIPKPISDEPEKHSIDFRSKEKNVGLAGLIFKDNINKEEKDREFEDKLSVPPTVTIQQTIPPTNFNEVTQDPTWNYLHTPYTYYQNVYDQYRRNYGPAQPTPNICGLAQPTPYIYGVAQPTPNTFGLSQPTPNIYGVAQLTPNICGLAQPTPNMYGLAQSTPNVCELAQTTPNVCGLAQPTPNICGQETNAPKNYCVQINPYIYGQRNSDPNTSSSEITLPYFPNGYPPFDPDSTQIHRNKQEIENTIYPEVHTENSLDKIWRTWKDIDMKMRNTQINDTDESLDIDIRREGNKGDSVLNKVVNPYATSPLPININGALVYPYLSPGYRYMR